MTPIGEIVNRILNRALKRRREEDDRELVARFPVIDPEDAEIERAYAEPEIDA
jgi:hypothetical protein